MNLSGNELLQQIECIDNIQICFFVDVVETVKNQDISNYPIIIAHLSEFEFEIGIKLDISHKNLDFKVSTLEELYVKNLVLKDNLENFKNLYLKNTEKLCILLLSNDKPEFIFMPKQKNML